MSKQSIRQERRLARAARIRRQRILLAAVVILAVAAIAVLVYQNANQSEATPSGMVSEDLVVGTGPAAKVGDTVSVHYTGTLTDGQQFDSSRASRQPFTFTIGVSNASRDGMMAWWVCSQVGQGNSPSHPSWRTGMRERGTSSPLAQRWFSRSS
jgi:hypothetical protein